jgi:hypothetical protein
VTIPATTGTLLTTATAGVPVNGPAFSAYQSSAQTLSSLTDTKILFQTEEYDTNSNYDTSNSRFTPTVAGYYQINFAFRVNTTITGTRPMLYKNGIKYKWGGESTSSLSAGVFSLIYLNGTTDYVECYALVGTGQALSTGLDLTWFNGCLVRSAT